MAKKEELLSVLTEFGIVNESNQEKFEALTNADLESVVAVSKKNEELIVELGKSGAEKSELKEQLEVVSQKNEELVVKLNDSESEKSVLKEQLENSTVKTEVKKETKKVPGHSFTFRGVKYKFLDTAPKNIRYGGASRTQKELSELDEADVLFLIGDSSLIKKIKK